MNSLTQTEISALTATADLSKNLLSVPLGLLLPRHSKFNVRKTGRRQSIGELAASISRMGLLQNLIIIPAADGEHYEVVAGSRRLAALNLLAKGQQLPSGYHVPCLLVADASARTVSLAENLLHEAMHPADQFEAFAALVREGRPIEDIAADFGVTPLVVQRRLKLANVSPRLMRDYRAAEITLEQLMALTITDDHTAQEAVFYDAPQWQRSASALRERLTVREMNATQPLVRFVGLDHYLAAGGQTNRDLFAEDDRGIWLTDGALLERLARDRLEVLAADVRTEGWAWVEAIPHLNYDDRVAFRHAPQQRREPSAREARRLAVLAERLARLEDALEAAREDGDEARAATLLRRYGTLTGNRCAIEAGLVNYAPDIRALAGALVTVDRDGQAVIHRGLLREAEARALDTLEKLKRNGGRETQGDDNEEDTGEPSGRVASLPNKLAQRLSAHRTAALQVQVARHPHVALAALMQGMVQAVLQEGHCYGRSLLPGVQLTLQDRLEQYAPDWPESPAAVALRELHQQCAQGLPEEEDELFATLLAKPQDELVRLLAACVAATVDVVTPRAPCVMPGEALARAARLDMADWWKPTAEGYFLHVSKATILEAAKQFAPHSISRLGRLKKNDLAAEAERLAAQAAWMPAIFTDDGAPEPEPEDATEEPPQDKRGATHSETPQDGSPRREKLPAANEEQATLTA